MLLLTEVEGWSIESSESIITTERWLLLVAIVASEGTNEEIIELRVRLDLIKVNTIVAFVLFDNGVQFLEQLRSIFLDLDL